MDQDETLEEALAAWNAGTDISLVTPATSASCLVFAPKVANGRRDGPVGSVTVSPFSSGTDHNAASEVKPILA